MIFWLASYPHSGDTYLGSLIASYFYTRDGAFGPQLSSKIKQFPSRNIFNQIGVDTNDKYKIAENYTKAQEEINKTNKLEYWKTNSSFCKMYNKFNFSDLKNSLGVIYIVRDPRDVISSLSEETGKNINETYEILINDRAIGNKIDEPEVYIGSWSFNFNSWKIYKNSNKYFLIKYEELIQNTKNIFIQTLDFINSQNSAQFPIHNDKIDKIIETTEHNKIQNLNLNKEFNQNIYSKKIEEKFENEMIEIGYL